MGSVKACFCELLMIAVGFGVWGGSSMAQGAATCKWTAAADGNWNTPSNWTNQTTLATGLPGTADTALIGDASPGYTVTLNSAAAVAGVLFSNGYGTLDINAGGTLTVTSGINLGVGNNGTVGTINQADGTVSAGTLTMGQYTYGRKGYYNLSGGTFTLTGNANVGNSGHGYFVQSAGTATVGGALNLISGVNGIPSGDTVGSYTISGGALTVTGNLVNGAWGSSTGTGNGKSYLQVIGSTATITVNGAYVTGTQVTTGALRSSTLSEFIDNNGISKINVAGSASLDGTLNMSVKGGSALTASKNFTLIEAGSITGDFSTKPNANLWSVGQVADVNGTRDAVVASLADSGNAATLINGVSSGMAFTGLNAGYVTLTGLQTGESVDVYLGVTAGSHTIDQLVSYFTTNGLVASADSTDGYDIKLSFTAQSGTSYYVWDLSGFDTASAIDGVAYQRAAVPEPATLAVLGLAGLGMLGMPGRKTR